MTFALSWNNASDLKECMDRVPALRGSWIERWGAAVSLLHKMPVLHVLEMAEDTGGKCVPAGGACLFDSTAECLVEGHGFSAS